MLQALTLVVKDQLVDGLQNSEYQIAPIGTTRVHYIYISKEFLTGRLLENNLINFGLHDAASSVVEQRGFRLEELLAEEKNYAFGNGGLGRAGEQIMVPVFGRTKVMTDQSGNPTTVWLNWDLVVGVPCDVPVSGFGGKTVNWLRLYTVKSSAEFNDQISSSGNYLRQLMIGLPRKKSPRSFTRNNPSTRPSSCGSYKSTF